MILDGGRNSAIETALQLYRAGADVSLSYRRENLNGSGVKYRVKPDFDKRVAPETPIPYFQGDTLETETRGLFVAGTITGGNVSGKVFIENSRHHGDMILKALRDLTQVRTCRALIPKIRNARGLSICPRRLFMFQYRGRSKTNACRNSTELIVFSP